MDQERQVKILEATFNYIDDIIVSCVVDDESQTRANIETRLEEDLRSVIDADHREVIIEASIRLNEMTYEQLSELKYLLSDDEDIQEEEEEEEEVDTSVYFDLDLPIRVRLLESDLFDKIAILNDKGEKEVYEHLGRFLYKSKYILRLKRLPQSRAEEAKAPKRNLFFEHVLEEDPEKDSLVRITDKKLLTELRKEAKFLFGF